MKINLKYFLKNKLDGDENLLKDRVTFIVSVFIVVFFIVSARIVHLGYFRKKKDYNNNLYNNGTLEKRVNIVDKNGVIIAADITLSDFYLNIDLLENIDDTVEKIVGIFPDINKQRTLDRLFNAKTKLILIKKSITEKQEESIKNSGIVGFEFEKKKGRIYPHQNLFSHIVGFTNIDGKGISGIELQYNNYLNNHNNAPLVLTLDSRVQAILRQELLKGQEKYKAKSMIGIVSEIKTGNVLALVNIPDFDPNKINIEDRNLFFNRATLGVYEMGSIFKIFTIALGLDKNLITQNEKFDVSQTISFQDYEIKQEYFSKKFMNASEILERSSNVGASLIGLKIGTKNMKEFLENIGLFDRIQTNYPSLGAPIVPQSWRDINTVTISYGYGVAVTPLHVTMGINGIVNDGVVMTPKFVGNEKYIEKIIVSPQTSKILNLYLRNAVRVGTGWKANVLGYAVGGKTGSARILKNGKYEKGNIMANFIGIFPMNNPTYSVYVMVESPQVRENNIEVAAGNIAAPIVGRTIENIAPILNVVPYITNKP
ncbi:MAG: penicillin-binding protein 2 [Rickettsiales bacterium]|jgi:cell division protein FtsI (penicillin-binding protein 3)|nr:penicillin-binding protein 2 [Rickettsiales bacterium]